MDIDDKTKTCCASHDSGEKENLTKDETLWGILVHLSSLAQLLFIPLTHVICPLILWLIKKDSSAWVDKQGRAAVNFNFSVLLYGLIASATMLVGIGFFLLPIIAVFWLVCTIMASIKASDGKCFRYPLCIRFIK